MAKKQTNPRKGKPAPRRFGCRVSRKGLVSFIATCNECDWHTDNYLCGQKMASAHVRTTGHKVNAESVYSIIYGG